MTDIVSDRIYPVSMPKGTVLPAVTYRRNTGTWQERVCAENLRNYGVAPDPNVPKAEKPDF